MERRRWKPSRLGFGLNGSDPRKERLMTLILTYELKAKGSEPFQTKIKVKGRNEEDCFEKGDKIIDEEFGGYDSSIIDIDDVRGE